MDQPTIKMRVKEKEGAIWLRALIKHPMETSLRKDKKTGTTIPPHYISDGLVESNGETVFSADWGTSISKNPFGMTTFTTDAQGAVLEATTFEVLLGI